MSCSAARGAFLAEMLDAAVKAKARLGTKGPTSRSWLHPWARLRITERRAPLSQVVSSPDSPPALARAVAAAPLPRAPPEPRAPNTPLCPLKRGPK